MRGNLTLTALPPVIRTLYAGRKSGILHFSCRPSPRRIFFRQGRIVRVESDAESDRFGEELVEAGRIQRDELNEALDLAAREGTSVGRALVDRKRLAPGELAELEVRRMSAIVHSLLASTAGEFHFEEAEDPVAEGEAFEIPAERVILDGVRQIADAAQLRRLIGDLRAVLRPTPSSPLPLFTVKMTPAERGLLAATRKRRPFSTEQLLSASRLSDVDTLRAVYALISIGLVEVDETPQTLRLEAIERSETVVEAASEPAPKPAAQGAAVAPAAAVPRRIGRFELQRLLVRNSTGEVFRGRDPEIDRIVVIKVSDATAILTPAGREKYLEIFEREVERAKQLYHPGVVAILEKGLTEDGRPFIVTEHVQGTTLRDLLTSGPLAVKHALELATQILETLAYAHSRGVVHRRVEPSNVLVTPDGRAKIKDFGLPRLADADLSASLPYVSPEEIATGKSDARADVFSFGVVSYRMLTGALPFPADSFSSFARALQPFDPPAPIEEYGNDFPPRLGKIVLRCLAREPLERFADAGELKAALSAPVTPAPADEEVASAPPAPTAAPTIAADRANPQPSVSAPAENRLPSPPEPKIAAPVVEATPPEEPVDASLPTRRTAETEVTEAPSTPAPAATEPAPVEIAPRQESSRRSPRAASQPTRPAAPRTRARRFKSALAAVLSLAAVALAIGAGWTLISREDPWKGLPSAPASDVSVEPIPVSPPSEAVLEALLAGPTDEELFANASSVLERGDLEASRNILIELLERNPDFPGARALLEHVDAQRRKAAERMRREAALEPEPEPVASGPSDTDLFSEAENAFARGELAVSKIKLEALLEVNPGFSGAAELMEKIEHRIWTTTLPLSFAARHNHRIGGCDGALSFNDTGLSFRSDDHDWAWGFDELISMERPDPNSFNVVTGDRDLLGILSNKRFKFNLEEPLSDDDWRFFRMTVEDGERTSALEN